MGNLCSTVQLRSTAGDKSHWFHTIRGTELFEMNPRFPSVPVPPRPSWGKYLLYKGGGNVSVVCSDGGRWQCCAWGPFSRIRIPSGARWFDRTGPEKNPGLTVHPSIRTQVHTSSQHLRSIQQTGQLLACTDWIRCCQLI